MELRTWVALFGVGALAACGEQYFPAARATRSAPLATSRADSGSSDEGAWSINASIPEPLAQSAAVASADGTRIYLIGGVAEDGVASNRVWIYSTQADVWSRGAVLPVEPGIRTYGAAAEVGGFIYVFGGYDGTTVLDTTWIYDEVKDAWSKGANLPGPRFGPAVSTDGDLIWMIGGMAARSIGDETGGIWRYEPRGDRWFYEGFVGNPHGRSRSVMLPNGDIHLFGSGFDATAHTVFNLRVGCFPCWDASIPMGVTDAAYVTDGQRIYVAGGAGPAPRAEGNGRLQIFDVTHHTWSVERPMPKPPLDNTTGAIANGQFYVLGGFDGDAPTSVNFSRPLSMPGAADAVAPASAAAGAPAPIWGKVAQAPSEASPWSINWPVPEVFGVAQGSTLSSSDGSLIYHIGGWVGSGLYASNRVRVYLPGEDSRDASSLRSPWWDVAAVPEERGIRTYGSAVELNGFIYLFGGVSGVAPGEYLLNATWIYDEARDAWHRGADMPGYRFGAAVATDGDVIWVIGGFGGGTEDIWRYEPSSDSYLTGFAPMPRRLYRIHGVYLPDGTVHVLGGGDLGSLTNHLVYDTAADAWSSASPIPVGILDPAVVTDGALIYLVGAPPPRGPAITQIFDPAANAWWQGQPVPPWPSAPGGMDNTSGAIADGILYVMGGYTSGTIFFNYSVALSELAEFPPAK